jgi:hypothetical protein
VIYLATPYSSSDLTTLNWRYQRAREALFGLWDQHHPAVCPIILGHEYEQRQRTGPRSLPHDFWMMMARAQLVACTHVYVLTLKGWDESNGVKDEVLLAAGMNKPIIGYAPYEHCEDVSGMDIVKTFGGTKQLRPKSLVVPFQVKEEE